MTRIAALALLAALGVMQRPASAAEFTSYAIVREDAPWIWGYHPVGFGLYHAWYHNAKPMAFGRNTLKYKCIDATLRHEQRLAWNEPVTTPLWVALGITLLSAIPATISLYRRERGVTRA